MDRARAFSPSYFGQENPPRSPSQSDSDDELFYQFFDWYNYCQSPTPQDSLPHHYSPRHSSHQNFTDVVNDIPDFIEKLETDFLRMTTSFQPEDEVGDSSVYSGHTPPELYQGGSTSPSDHSGSTPYDHTEYGYYGPEVSLRDVQAQDDQWTYPQSTSRSKVVPTGYSKADRTRATDAPGRRSREEAVGLKRRRSGNGGERRPRHLADPGQTADVRKSGACLPCRVSKTRCDNSGVCPTCRKSFPDHSHLVCTRLTPIMAWPVIGKIPDLWSRHAREEEDLCSEPRFHTGKPREIRIFFTAGVEFTTLPAIVQGYQTYGDAEEAATPRKAAFPREMVPSHRDLQTWAEAQIQHEHSSDFERCVQYFLFSYAVNGAKLPKHGLVSKVHKMNCFFKIWKTASFKCRDPSNKVTTLPISVQAQLRNLARKGLDSLEYDVLKEIDDCVTQQGSKPQERLAIWASLWQLMLIYREVFGTFRARVEPLMGSGPDGAMMHPICVQYRTELDTFFPLLSMFYHYQFRTKKSLEFSLSWLKDSRSGKALVKPAQQLMDARREFYFRIQTSPIDEVDQLLAVFVVNHEVKKLNTRSRTSKSSSKSRSRSNLDDDCDDDRS